MAFWHTLMGFSHHFYVEFYVAMNSGCSTPIVGSWLGPGFLALTYPFISVV